MTVLNECIEVDRPVDEVFAYVSDFSTTQEWDATAQTARKLTPGEIAVGTQFEVVCALPVGSVTLVYTVEELQQDERLVLYGEGRFFNVRDTIEFASTGTGTRLDYQAEFEFPPLLQSVATLSESGLENMGRESVAGLQEALEDDFDIVPAEPQAGEVEKWPLPALSLFSRLGYTRGRKRFNPISAWVGDKHMVITGASAGIGYATAEALAARGAQLTLVMRDRAKAEKTVASLQALTGNTRIQFELADLSLMSEVDKLVRRLNKRGRPIDVLINNAGALFNPRGETSEGLEQSFALLLLSPYRLTLGVKALLDKAPGARVINVVSGGMYSQQLRVDELLNSESQGGYSGSAAYAREKRALMVVTEEWAADWEADGIVVNAMHPGWADTPGVRSALPQFRAVTRPVLRSAAEGADTIVWLACATEADQLSGELFLDRQARPTHMARKTLESADERAKLMNFLADFPQ